MPEQPTVIIQNTNQQNNDGCSSGCGTGCLLLIVASVLLFPLGMMGSALEGEAPGYWIPIGIFLTLVEVLVIGVIAFVWLDKKFGWGYSDQPNPNENTIRAEDLAGDARNYGVESAPPAGEAPRQQPRSDPKKPNLPKGRRIPHPDDDLFAGSRGVDQSVRLSGKQEQAPSDVYERLRRLKALLDESHITREEYEAKKAELLKLL